jgi:hypothetical protein
MNVLTDKGYTTGKQIAECTANNITTYSSPKAPSSQNNGLYDMQIFEYHEAEDTYTCPAGETMMTNGRWYNKSGHKVKHYKTKACKSCSLREQCTKNKNGRLIERNYYQPDVEQNQARVEANPDYYRQRQQITEHQFGTLKRQWHFNYTLVKGKEKVLSEVYLCFTANNLVRLIQILGIEELKSKLGELVLTLIDHIEAFLALLRGCNQKRKIGIKW